MGENSRFSPSIDTRRQKIMTRFNIVGVVTVLSLMSATPVFAQEAIQEPGEFAFYHPNLDVLNGGAPTPASRMDDMAGYGPFSGSYAYAPSDGTAYSPSRARRYRSYEPAPGTFLGYRGRP
jgi:hypothetical protein